MSTQLPYRLEVQNGKAVVALLPEMNACPWADIERIGNEILGRVQELPQPTLLVDLCPLDYMGSAQVALVVRIWKAVKERDGRMVVANQHPMVQEVLTMAGLNKVWTIVRTRDEGLSRLGMTGGGESSVGDSGSGGPSVMLSLAIVALVVAAIGLMIQLANPAAIPGQGAIWIQLAGAGVAFLLGLVGINLLSDSRRTWSLAVLIASVGVILSGVYFLAKGTSAVAPPAEVKASAEAEATPTKATEPAEQDKSPGK